MNYENIIKSLNKSIYTKTYSNFMCEKSFKSNLYELIDFVFSSCDRLQIRLLCSFIRSSIEEEKQRNGKSIFYKEYKDYIVFKVKYFKIIDYVFKGRYFLNL